MQPLAKSEAKAGSGGVSLKLRPPLDALQNQCSALVDHIHSSLAGAAASLQPRLDAAVENLFNQGKRSLLAGIPPFAFSSSSPSLRKRNLAWARIPQPDSAGGWEETTGAQHRFDLAMSTETVEERLAGIPVYALSNSAEEFVLVSGVKSGRSLGLFCFRKEDAEALLEQMRSMSPGMREGSKVVAVALNKARVTQDFLAVLFSFPA